MLTFMSFLFRLIVCGHNWGGGGGLMQCCDFFFLFLFTLFVELMFGRISFVWVFSAVFLEPCSQFLHENFIFEKETV